MIKCTNCGFDQIPEGGLHCPQCGTAIGQPIPPPPEAAPAGEIPWKDRARLGFVQAFIETIKAMITNPMGFFGKNRKDDDWASPLLWICIIAWIGGFFSFLWSSLLSLPMIPFMRHYGGMGAGMSPFMMGHVARFFLMFVFAPLIYIIGAFIGAALVHVAALVFGDGEKGFEVTFKAVAYSMSGNLLNVIPFCGGMIAGVVNLVFLIIGMKQGHRTEWWKAVLSVLIWVVLLFICCGIVALVGGLAMANFLHSTSAS